MGKEVVNRVCSCNHRWTDISTMPTFLPVRTIIIFVCFLQSVHASWWYLGVVGSSQVTMQKPQQQQQGNDCTNLPYLSADQRTLCSKERKLLNVLSAGASMGIEECKHQFQNRRWNCSTYNTTSVFGKVLSTKSRETAYIYAISSAGAMFSITRACARGELENCGCDTSVRQKDTRGRFEWGGCSENIRYGEMFAKEFVDSKEAAATANGLMNLWNNQAGRKVTKDEVDLICKCHGVSGSCSVKICWRKMKPFRAIGAALKDKFDGASKVKFNQRKRKLRPISKFMKKPSKQDLVYLHDSPDFCEYNPEKGSLGTKGRQCNRTSYGLDGCTLMCCGRGYYTIVKTFVEDCNCKFFWCCRVECKKCSHVKEMHFCN